MRQKGLLRTLGNPGAGRIAALLLALALSVAPAQAKDQSDQLAVPLFGQQTNVWCWDASSLMVMEYLRRPNTLEECTLASQATGKACCATPIPAPCVVTGWEMLSSNKFLFQSSASPLAWTDLVAQISAKRKPVLFAWAWVGGSGHMMVAIGWRILAGEHFVLVNDPMPQPGPQDPGGSHHLYAYDAWVGGAGYDHSFWSNWFDIVDGAIPKGGPIGHVPTPIILGNLSSSNASTLLSQSVVRPEITRRATVTLEAIRAASPALAADLGFVTAEEARQAELDTPLREFYVRLDTLRDYAPHVPVARALSGGTTLFYPLLSRGVIRSFLRVSAPEGGPAKTISLGDSGTAKRLELLKDLLPRVQKGGGESVPAVRIPALGLYFIARTHGSTLQIASLFDAPRYGLEHGRYENAEAVLARLAPFARSLPDGAM
jgi:hypothetical protein